MSTHCIILEPRSSLPRNSSLPSSMGVSLMMLYQLQGSVIRIPHLLADPFLQIRVSRGYILFLRQTVLDRLFDHIACDLDTNLAHIFDIGQEASAGAVKDRGLGRKSLDGSY